MNFIYAFGQYFLGECGFQESTFYNAATHLKTVCRLAYREGLADVLLFDKAKISKGNKRLPKALDKEALDKLKALNFEDLEEEMETARDIFLFACYTGAAYCDLMELDKSHLVHDDEGSNMQHPYNRQRGKYPLPFPFPPPSPQSGESLTSQMPLCQVLWGVSCYPY